MKASDYRFVVVYKTGGTENAKWNMTMGMTKPEAENALDNVKRMGYDCRLTTREQAEKELGLQ
jgi:hypothetical protein